MNIRFSPGRGAGVLLLFCAAILMSVFCVDRVLAGNGSDDDLFGGGSGSSGRGAKNESSGELTKEQRDFRECISSCVREKVDIKNVTALYKNWGKLNPKLRAALKDDIAISVGAGILLADNLSSDKKKEYFGNFKSNIPDIKDFNYQTEAECEKCDGSGKVSEKCKMCGGSGRCHNCKGRGETGGEVSSLGTVKPYVVCKLCNGTGICKTCHAMTLKVNCPECGGTKQVLSKEKCRRLFEKYLKKAFDNCR